MTEIKFKNGSYIEIISSNDSYRSKRYEEQWEYWKQNSDKFIEEFVDLLPHQNLLKVLTLKDRK